jgi:hypothetical protein
MGVDMIDCSKRKLKEGFSSSFRRDAFQQRSWSSRKRFRTAKLVIQFLSFLANEQEKSLDPGVRRDDEQIAVRLSTVLHDQSATAARMAPVLRQICNHGCAVIIGLQSKGG